MMTRMDTMTREEIAALQRQLTELGYGELVPDGVWGQKTAAAYAAYLATHPLPVAVAPAPAKAWWLSSALLGSAVSVLAWGASLVGYEFDAERLGTLLPEVVGLGSAIVAVVGTWRRKAPIDATLVLPGVRVRDGALHRVSNDAAAALPPGR